MTWSLWLGLDGYLSRPKKKKEKILNALGNPQRPTSVASQTTDLNWEELLGRK